MEINIHVINNSLHLHRTSGAMSCMEQITILELPNEVIEKIFAYLSSADLLSLGVVGNKKLRYCCYSLLHRKPHGKYYYLPQYKHILFSEFF